MESFIEFLRNNNINYTPEMLNKLEVYYKFLVQYNNRVNLTAITEKSDVYLKHFADSLLGLEFIPDDAMVCDIGTGAGFPGVVLKIFKPSIKLYLVDSLNKRIVFLSELIKLLNLSDVTIIHSRAEDNEFKTKFLNKFDIVVARAVANINTLIEYCLPYVKVGGKFIAYKSNEMQDELIGIKNALKLLGGNEFVCKNKHLNSEIERKFVIFNKIVNTDDKYPRGQNKPRLMPLK